MNKCKYIILTIILLLFITNIDIVINSTKYASILFFNKIFISIFPFIILCDILIYFDYHIFLSNTLGKYISKIFNIDKNSTIIFILSILTSHPANAIYIKDMLDNNEIDINTANRILCFTYFPSISFVIGTIGVTIYKNINIGIILWLFVLLNNVLIGLYLKNNNYNKININNKTIKNNLFITIKNSILKAINTSIIILGNLIIFTIISNLIKEYIDINVFLIVIEGILELTNGIILISNFDVNIALKLSITLFILCFSSLSILFQSITILNNYNIKIKRILIIKLIFSIITSILFYYFLIFLHIS